MKRTTGSEQKSQSDNDNKIASSQSLKIEKAPKHGARYKKYVFVALLLLLILFIHNQFNSVQQEEAQEYQFVKEKQNFLNRFGKYYGYSGKINELRETEFSRYKDQVYLDYTASGQYQVSQIREQSDLLTDNLFNNPHSRNPSSLFTEDSIHEIRNKILAFFNTNKDEYSVVFTSGATGALKIISESFPWEPNSEFWYSTPLVRPPRPLCARPAPSTPLPRPFHDRRQAPADSMLAGQSHAWLGSNARPTRFDDWNRLDFYRYSLYNHNSVLGIREIALDNKVSYRCFDEDEINKKIEDAEKGKVRMQDSSYNLFAYPAECNFSGSKFPLEWIEKFHNRKIWGKNV